MTVDLTTLGFLSSCTEAFLNKDQKLLELIPETHPFHSIENAINGKMNFDKNKRKTLVDVIKKQYENIIVKDDVKVIDNINLLLDENTFTVTTGQQLHLFLGPAFVIYKIISTIKAAESYKLKFPDKNFVPIFWLASEDHDFDEIKNTFIFGETYEWKTNQSGAIGKYTLEGINALFVELESRFEKDKNALKIIADFKQFYTSSETLSQATIKLVHFCFKKYGIVCLDANEHKLKSYFSPIIKAELLEGNTKLLFDSFSENLKTNELSLQLKARPINLFYLSNNLRSRIEKVGDEYVIQNTELKYSEKEILTLLENEPERFSPNAVLRPIYQETILPNAVYIAGNAELNYWIQLTDVFKENNISAPSIILRQSAWFSSPKIYDWLESKQIDIVNLFKAESKKEILALFKKEDKNEFEDYINEFELFKIKIQNLTAKEIGTELKNLVETNKEYVKRLNQLVSKKQTILEEKYQKDIIKLEQIQSQGLSQKNIQERTKYSIEFLIKMPNFIEICFNNLEFCPKFGYFLSI